MSYFASRYSKKNADKNTSSDTRLRILLAMFVLAGMGIAAKLAILMVFQHDFYTALAAGSREVYSNLFPQRGEVFIQNSRTKEEYPLAINRDYFLVFADTRAIQNDKTAEDVAQKLSEIFSYDEQKKLSVYFQLNKRNDPYEPIGKKVEQAAVDRLKEMGLPGINFVRQPFRYYPEGSLAAQVIGFLGKDIDGNDIGRYGIEGYWQKDLAGKKGFFAGAKSAVGGLIPLAGWSLSPAEDGADLLLTIDRTLQYQACEKLRQGMKEYSAKSASLVAMDPKTGAIRAMCALPDFDPNKYNEVDALDVYNNSAIFTPYEPGSIFKPVTMAAAIYEGAVGPETIFHDPGTRSEFCSKPIKNAAEKTYGTQTMTGVLQNSINTGMVFVVEKLGKKKFRQYLENFGFGVKEGIELDKEEGGTIDALYKNKSEKIDCYTATASFGQGIAVTPLQMAAAFSAIVNGGKLMKPYIVEEVRYADGRVEKARPKEIRQVLDSRTSMLLRGMLVNVVERGHAKRAQIKGYYVGGKTGTAQISGPGGYTEETNQSFVGFAPADDTKFVMIVKYEKPQRTFAEYTAVPVFGEIAKFMLEYYQVPASR